MLQYIVKFTLESIGYDIVPHFKSISDIFSASRGITFYFFWGGIFMTENIIFRTQLLPEKNAVM